MPCKDMACIQIIRPGSAKPVLKHLKIKQFFIADRLARIVSIKSTRKGKSGMIFTLIS
jgi:hypothetical protein